jgi:lipopolysaccharide transport system permease protein
MSVSGRRVPRLPTGALEVFEQLEVLVASDLRARYGRGGWRLVKWVVDPFALVGIYLLLVTFIFYRRGYAVGLSLACGIIPFQLLTMTVSNSLSAVNLRRSIIANMKFRRVLLPIATTLTETVGFAASLLLLALMMCVYGVVPNVDILWLPVALVMIVLMSVAAAYPAALLGIWAPGITGLILSFVRALYFIAPGLVTLAEIHGRTNSLVRLNPLTGIMETLRHAVYYRSAPPAWEILYPVGVAVALLLIFVPIYHREQVHFVKVVE